MSQYYAQYRVRSAKQGNYLNKLSKGLATLRNVANLQFVAEVSAEVVRDVSRSARVV